MKASRLAPWVSSCHRCLASSSDEDVSPSSSDGPSCSSTLRVCEVRLREHVVPMGRCAASLPRRTGSVLQASASCARGRAFEVAALGCSALRSRFVPLCCCGIPAVRLHCVHRDRHGLSTVLLFQAASAEGRGMSAAMQVGLYSLQWDLSPRWRRIEG